MDDMTYERLLQIHAWASHGDPKPDDLTAEESAAWDRADAYYADARKKGWTTYLPPA